MCVCVRVCEKERREREREREREERERERERAISSPPIMINKEVSHSFRAPKQNKKNKTKKHRKLNIEPAKITDVGP